MSEQNLELRRKVAEAIGCKASIEEYHFSFLDKSVQMAVCLCDDSAHADGDVDRGDDPFLPKYDTDHHAALDALMAFCERKARWDLEDWGDLYDLRYICRIVIDPRCEAKCFVGRSKSLALAICEAIVMAAEKEGEGD